MLSIWTLSFCQLLIILFGTVTAKPNPSVGNTVEQVSGILKAGANLTANILVPPETTRESARLEDEGLASRILTVYDSKHQQSANLLNPQPIIDTIREEEKYGNNGDRFYGFGRAIVNGYEIFANFMNRLLDAPGKVAKSIVNNVTAKLDQVGGKLVGLA